ncbi:MAG TPA: hypothetical protein VI248_09780 [Kineosporiaceae bacterium]
MAANRGEEQKARARERAGQAGRRAVELGALAEQFSAGSSCTPEMLRQAQRAAIEARHRAARAADYARQSHECSAAAHERAAVLFDETAGRSGDAERLRERARLHRQAAEQDRRAAALDQARCAALESDQGCGARDRRTGASRGSPTLTAGRAGAGDLGLRGPGRSAETRRAGRARRVDDMWNATCCPVEGLPLG